jgi:hypothetical protein
MRTVQEHWESFEKLVINKNAGATQRKEMRNAFYAGAQSTLLGIMEVGASNVSEEAGAHIIEGYNQELSEFAKRIAMQG